MRVLLVQDCRMMACALREGLQRAGIFVDVALNRATAEELLGGTDYDVLILDQPALRGEDARRRAWRGKGVKPHVLALVTGTEISETAGPEVDDRLSKPFGLRDLVGRLRRLADGTPSAKGRLIRVHDLEIDTGARTVSRAGKAIRLTKREYEILELLAIHRGRVVTRPMIWERLYDEHDANTSNVLDVYIRYLRRKIDVGFSPALILTRRGQGYLLRGD